MTMHHLAVDATASTLSGWANTGLLTVIGTALWGKFLAIGRRLDAHSQALVTQSHALDVQSRALAIVVAKIDPSLALLLHQTSADPAQQGS